MQGENAIRERLNHYRGIRDRYGLQDTDVNAAIIQLEWVLQEA